MVDFFVVGNQFFGLFCHSGIPFLPYLSQPGFIRERKRTAFRFTGCLYSISDLEQKIKKIAVSD
jgi:hypothetical protein